MATIVYRSEVKIAEHVRPDYSSVAMAYPTATGYFLLQRGAGTNAGYITPMHGHNIGVEVSEVFTGDQRIVGSVVRLRSMDRPLDLGEFEVLDISEIRNRFKATREFLADRIIQRHAQDPNIFLMTEDTFSGLKLKEGEEVRYLRDPTVRPISELFRPTPPLPTPQQMPVREGLEDIFQRSGR